MAVMESTLWIHGGHTGMPRICARPSAGRYFFSGRRGAAERPRLLPAAGDRSYPFRAAAATSGYRLAAQKQREVSRPPLPTLHVMRIYGPTSKPEPVEPRPPTLSRTRVSSSVASAVGSTAFARIEMLS